MRQTLPSNTMLKQLVNNVNG